MSRPMTLVFQESAQSTPQVAEPDLNVIVIAPVYQIRDYEDDKEAIQVASYGELNANNPYTPPPASVPAIELAAPPDITAGAWVDPLSVRVYFDDVRVIMVEGTDGSVTTDDNLLTSAGATFIDDGIAVGDTLIIEDPSAGPDDLVLTISSIESQTTLRVTRNFVATTASLDYRIEHRMDDQLISSDFVVTPVFRQDNALTILGGVELTYLSAARVVSYANVYVAYRAYRTDLQFKDVINETSEIETKVGRIDARNKAAGLLSVAKQNAGAAPVYFFGVETDDLTGYSKAKDALSSDKAIYAVIPGKADLAIAAMFKADCVSLADPTLALSRGVPQKFRVVVSSEELITTRDIVDETVSGLIEQKSGAIPPGVRRITLAGLSALTAGVKPGDRLILSYSDSTSPLDGTYAISHINSATELEVDSAFPMATTTDGANYRIFRPSLNTNVVAEVESRAFLNNLGVRYYANVGGVPAGARTIALVDSGVANNLIASIVEVAGVSTVITLDVSGTTTITAQQVVDALNDGTGVTTPFAGSVNLIGVATTPSTVQSAGLAAVALSTGTAGVNTVTSTQALDAVFIRIFDAAAEFLTAGVIAGDLIEIPYNPVGVFTDTGTKRYVVNEVLSEQRIEIADITSGNYVNNSSTVENELPHYDDRRGLGVVVTPGSTAVRYKVIRELTKDQQVDALIALSQSLRNQRAILCWPDLCDVADLVDGSKTRNADGTPALADPQDGTYLAAMVGGMTAGQPNHQGFSRMAGAGVRRLYHSSRYFTEDQLSTLSDGGWYVFAQDTPESLPYAIHQLTTDPSALETGEYSMVKNLDYLSKFYVALLDPFIGVWNVNQDTLGFVRNALNSGTLQLKTKRYARIGAPLNEATILSLDVSDLAADRIEVFLGIDRPKPLNVIGLHLVG